MFSYFSVSSSQISDLFAPIKFYCYICSAKRVKGYAEVRPLSNMARARGVFLFLNEGVTLG